MSRGHFKNRYYQHQLVLNLLTPNILFIFFLLADTNCCLTSFQIPFSPHFLRQRVDSSAISVSTIKDTATHPSSSGMLKLFFACLHIQNVLD